MNLMGVLSSTQQSYNMPYLLSTYEEQFWLFLYMCVKWIYFSNLPKGPGEPFGDVALLSEDCIRTASVISDEVTDLLVVDRSLYNRSVRDVLAREFERKKTFIENHPLFSNWAPKYRTQLAMAMYQETLPYEGMLVKQGEPLSNIYFILE